MGMVVAGISSQLENLNWSTQLAVASLKAKHKTPALAAKFDQTEHSDSSALSAPLRFKTIAYDINRACCRNVVRWTDCLFDFRSRSRQDF
jgi:hypothetical protein